MSLFIKSEYGILKIIYENHGIRLTSLMQKARVSAATLKIRVGKLLERGIIKEEKIFGKKKVILKNLYPNFESEYGKQSFSLIELEKRHEFLKKNKNLAIPFKQLANNVKGIKVILVFGSFANYSETRDSDLDILILGDKLLNKEMLKKEIERSFATFNHEISPRIDTYNNFRKNKTNEIYQTIIQNHVVIYGALNFIEMVK